MAAIKGAKADITVLSQSTDLVCSRLNKISSVWGVSVVPVSSMIHSVSQLWGAPALASSEENRNAMQGCMTQLLHTLQPLLPQLTPRQACNTLQALARMTMPVSAVPDHLVVELTQQVAAGSANAQELAGALSALVQWKDSVPEVPIDATALQALCQQYAKFDDKTIHKRPASSREAFCILVRAAELQIRPFVATLDAICAHIVALDQQQPAKRQRLSAQSIAMMLQALSEMRYMPEPHQAEHLLERFAALCTQTSPGPNTIRCVLAAAARLGMTESSQAVWGIGVQVMNMTEASDQTLFSVARCMAALDVLDLDVFVILLDTLIAHYDRTRDNTHLMQLYQVLYKLEPHPQDSESKHLAWEGACQKVEELGHLESALHGFEPLYESLVQLGVPHTRHVPISTYTADAVVYPRSPNSEPLLLVIFRDTDKLLNKGGRYALNLCTHCLLIG